MNETIEMIDEVIIRSLGNYNTNEIEILGKFFVNIKEVNTNMMYSEVGIENIMDIIYSETEKEQSVIFNFLFDIVFNLQLLDIYTTILECIQNTIDMVADSRNLDEDLVSMMTNDDGDENIDPLLSAVYFLKYNMYALMRITNR